MQFYQRVDTSKLPHVPTILAQYSTEDLLAALTARYGPDNLPRARVLPPAERAALDSLRKPPSRLLTVSALSLYM